jgi:hypothetical protein
MAAGGPRKDRLQAAIDDLLHVEALYHDTGNGRVSAVLDRLGQFDERADQVAAARLVLTKALADGLFELGDYSKEGFRPWGLDIEEAVNRACEDWMAAGDVYWEHQIFQLSATPKGETAGKVVAAAWKKRIDDVVVATLEALTRGPVPRAGIVAAVLAFPGESDPVDDYHAFSLIMQDLVARPDVVIGSMTAPGFAPWTADHSVSPPTESMREQMQKFGPWRNRATGSEPRADGTLGGADFILQRRHQPPSGFTNL